MEQGTVMDLAPADVVVAPPVALRTSPEAVQPPSITAATRAEAPPTSPEATLTTPGIAVKPSVPAMRGRLGRTLRVQPSRPPLHHYAAESVNAPDRRDCGYNGV